MISSEKDLEDYICNNQNDLIEILKEQFCLDEISFVGRQIKIGDENIADLVYCGKQNDKISNISLDNLIIVELKYRKLVPKDLAQLRRYMNTMISKDDYTNFMNVYGCFISFGCDEDMIEISKMEEDIIFLSIKEKLFYDIENYIYKDEYIDNIKLDTRLKKIMKSGDK